MRLARFASRRRDVFRHVERAITVCRDTTDLRDIPLPGCGCGGASGGCRDDSQGRDRHDQAGQAPGLRCLADRRVDMVGDRVAEVLPVLARP